MANEVCCVCGLHISNGEFVYDIDDGDYLLCDNPDCLKAYMKQYKKTVT